MISLPDAANKKNATRANLPITNPGARPEAFGGSGSVRSVAIHGRHSIVEASIGVSDPKGMKQMFSSVFMLDLLRG
jgi:hypothetical protein